MIEEGRETESPMKVRGIWAARPTWLAAWHPMTCGKEKNCTDERINTLTRTCQRWKVKATGRKKRTIRENNLQMRKREIHVWKGEKYLLMSLWFWMENCVRFSDLKCVSYIEFLWWTWHLGKEIAIFWASWAIIQQSGAIDHSFDKVNCLKLIFEKVKKNVFLALHDQKIRHLSHRFLAESSFSPTSCIFIA